MKICLSGGIYLWVEFHGEGAIFWGAIILGTIFIEGNCPGGNHPGGSYPVAIFLGCIYPRNEEDNLSEKLVLGEEGLDGIKIDDINGIRNLDDSLRLAFID